MESLRPNPSGIKLLRRRKSKGTLRTVWREGNQIVKEFRILNWPPDLRRPWKREHRALTRLNRSGVSSPTTYGYRSQRPGVTHYRREFIEGGLLQKTQLGAVGLADHFAAVHAAGVTNGDAALDNILVTGNRQLMLIDYGRARVAKIRGPLFYCNVGKELARIRRCIFENDPDPWQRFLERYIENVVYPFWGWSLIQRALCYWLRRWRVALAMESRLLDAQRAGKH